MRDGWPRVYRKYRSIRSGIRNLIRWAPVIWDDEDYDYAYLLRIMQWKLLKMSQVEGIHVGSDRNQRLQRMCAQLLQRITEDNYFKNAGYGDGSKWSSVTVVEQRRVANHAAKMEKQDLEYFCLIFNKHLRKWWE